MRRKASETFNDLVPRLRGVRARAFRLYRRPVSGRGQGADPTELGVLGVGPRRRNWVALRLSGRALEPAAVEGIAADTSYSDRNTPDARRKWTSSVATDKCQERS